MPNEKQRELADRIELVKPHEAAGEVKEIFEDIRRTKGDRYLTPTWGFFAHDPELLRLWWGLTKRLQIADGEVPQKYRNAISLICARDADCPRCINNHQNHLIDHFNMDLEEVEEILDFENSDRVPEDLKAVLTFARKVAFSEETTIEDLLALRRHGYGNRAIVEIASMAFLESSMARRAVGIAKFEDGELWPKENVPSEAYHQNVHA